VFLRQKTRLAARDSTPGGKTCFCGKKTRLAARDSTPGGKAHILVGVKNRLMPRELAASVQELLQT
jgi:hypothetical protein